MNKRILFDLRYYFYCLKERKLFYLKGTDWIFLVFKLIKIRTYP